VDEDTAIANMICYWYSTKLYLTGSAQIRQSTKIIKTKILSPTGISRQAYVTFFPILSFFLFKRSLEAKRSRKLQDHIFRSSRHVDVDVQSGIGFRIGQGSCHGNQI